METVEQGLAIRGARLGKRMTQAHLAAMSGVSEKTVRRAEAGEAIRADSARAICSSLGLDASDLRSEAEMRPDMTERLEGEMRRRAWASRAAVLFLSFAAVMGPLVAFYRDALEMRALLGILGVPFVLAAPPASLIYLASLNPEGRRLLAKVPGFPTAGRWLHARRAPLMTVGGIAAVSILLPCLGLAMHDLARSPAPWAVFEVVGLFLAATLGCSNVVILVSDDVRDEGPVHGGKAAVTSIPAANAGT